MTLPSIIMEAPTPDVVDSISLQAEISLSFDFLGFGLFYQVFCFEPHGTYHLGPLIHKDNKTWA